MTERVVFQSDLDNNDAILVDVCCQFSNLLYNLDFEKTKVVRPLPLCNEKLNKLTRDKKHYVILPTYFETNKPKNFQYLERMISISKIYASLDFAIKYMDPEPDVDEDDQDDQDQDEQDGQDDHDECQVTDVNNDQVVEVNDPETNNDYNEYNVNGNSESDINSFDAILDRPNEVESVEPDETLVNEGPMVNSELFKDPVGTNNESPVVDDDVKDDNGGTHANKDDVEDDDDDEDDREDDREDDGEEDDDEDDREDDGEEVDDDDDDDEGDGETGQ